MMNDGAEKKHVHRGRKESPSESRSSRSSSGSRGDRCGPLKGISPVPRRTGKNSREWSTTAVVSGPESSDTENEDKEEKPSTGRGRHAVAKEEHTARGRSTRADSNRGESKRKDKKKLSSRRRSLSKRSVEKGKREREDRQRSSSSDSDDERREKKHVQKSRERSREGQKKKEDKKSRASSKEEKKAKKERSVTPVKRPHRQWFQVDRFDGSTPWRPFAERFSFCAKMNGWDLKEQAAQLQSCLKGMAAQVLCYGKSQDWTFTELFMKLEDRFGSDDRSDEFLAKLETRKRGAKETLQQLCHGIEELVALAYPGPRSAHSDRFAVTSFLRALDDVEVAGKVRDKRPQTLDEAFRLAQMYDSFRTANNGGSFHDEERRGTKDKQARAVSATEEASVQQKNTGEKLSALEQKVVVEFQAMKNELDALRKMPPSGPAPSANVAWLGPPPSMPWPTVQQSYPPMLPAPPPSFPTNPLYGGGAQGGYGSGQGNTVPKYANEAGEKGGSARGERLCYGRNSLL